MVFISLKAEALIFTLLCLNQTNQKKHLKSKKKDAQKVLFDLRPTEILEWILTFHVRL